VVVNLQEIEQGLADGKDLFELASMEDDEDTMQAVEADVGRRARIPPHVQQPDGPSPCFMEIQAGAGGTEAQDWAGMLSACTCAIARKRASPSKCWKNPKVKWPASRAPPSSSAASTPTASCAPKPASTAWCARAPFDSNARRHTSFCRSSCFPEVDDSIEIDINPADVRTDTYRASGAGGQHINKTDSAVRLTHVPTGIVVQCQNDRSQHRNKDEAWQMLRARLYEAELRKRQSRAAEARRRQERHRLGPPDPLLRARPVRIKDLRTNYEVGNTQGVLDGDLDGFIQASLKQGV
jgi:peptide chain release factor 2